ncbi:hypothetical protein M0802_000357 [Mischocyttarus mexicanus]|nr:hypothetical protein M0802_000357 [Mischocyttarus mexicanus]
MVREEWVVERYDVDTSKENDLDEIEEYVRRSRRLRNPEALAICSTLETRSNLKRRNDVASGKKNQLGEKPKSERPRDRERQNEKEKERERWNSRSCEKQRRPQREER